jgi:endonuclease/exonuclease/phosphatase family metal-dependent hydrolase
MSLRVLSLNLWHNAGPYPARRARIREWIDLLQPDLIGFQEALTGPGFDQARELLDGSGFQVEHGTAVRFWNDESLLFGNVAASRWPLMDREDYMLPDAEDGERRMALSVTVDSPFGPVSFTITHLNWKPHHGWVRELQVAAVCDLVRRRRPRNGFPAVLVGDFNAVPDSDEIRYVKGLHSLNGRSVYFRDAWEVAGRGDGITWSNRNDYARPALEPDRRIDYIFVGPPRPNGLGLIEECRVVCDDARDSVWPSDHFGVFAVLRAAPLP